jgi:CheY-like chemotaxis protein
MADRAPRILLVDDEDAIQTLLSYPLRKEGYDVVQASDGGEALERFS